MLRTCATAAALWAIVSLSAAAQDQTIVVDQPLETCATPNPITTAALEESQAAAVIKAALRGKDPDPATY